MKLRDLLESMNADEKVKIGTELGTGWIYTGTVGEFLEDPMYENDRLIKEAQRRSYQAIETLNKTAKKMPTKREWDDGWINAESFSVALADWGSKLARTTLRTAAMVECFEKYTPLIKREVVEHYPAIGDEGTNIVVKGSDMGDSTKVSVAKMKPLSAETMSDKGAQRLAAAIYGEVTESLKETYKRIYKCRDEGKSPYKKDISVQKYHENWIRRDAYGILSDPNGIIKSCRAAAKSEYKEEKEKKGLANEAEEKQ